MIRAPKETKGFRRLPPVVVFRILNGSALSGFVNDGYDASVLDLLQVDAVAMVDVDDGVDHTKALRFLPDEVFEKVGELQAVEKDRILRIDLFRSEPE